MIFGIPLAIILGIATIISLFITASLGLIVYKFHKPVFSYHKLFALIAISLAVVHSILAYLLWFRGVLI